MNARTAKLLRAYALRNERSSRDYKRVWAAADHRTRGRMRRAIERELAKTTLPAMDLDQWIKEAR